MDSKYWLEIQKIVETVLGRLSEYDALTLGDIIYCREFIFRRVTADLSKTKNNANSIRFIFNESSSPTGLDVVNLLKIVINFGNNVYWVIDRDCIWLEYLGLTNKESVNMTIAWNSGRCNSEFYGKVSQLYITFAEGCSMSLNYPWCINPEINTEIEKLVKSFVIPSLKNGISLLENIDFNQKMEEIIASSGLRDML